MIWAKKLQEQATAYYYHLHYSSTVGAEQGGAGRKKIHTYP